MEQDRLSREPTSASADAAITIAATSNGPVEPPNRWLRVVTLIAGLVAPPVFMYGSSLVGNKLLLPLDILAEPSFYLPSTPEYEKYLPAHNLVFMDQVLWEEISRRFCTREFRAGRIPLWCPDYFLGAPHARWPKYSPFNAATYLFPTPVTLAWIHLLKCLVAGIGAFLFFRQSEKVGYWAAAIGAWCYPLTGFLVMWQGHSTSPPIVFYPWLLLMVEKAVRRPRPWSGPGLACITCLVVISGQVDVAGLALLASGLYGIWCVVDECRRLGSWNVVGRSTLVLAGGWALGMALSAPYVLPIVEYSRTGYRMQRRGSGVEERPPVGLSALPQVVMPDIYGRSQKGHIYWMDGNRLESAAGAYSGLVATLFLAPLAWIRRERFSRNLIWIVLIMVALSWTLNLPGFVSLWRMPGLNMLSYNRFVFAAGFAILAMAVTGLDVLWRGGFKVGRRIGLFLRLAFIMVIAIGGWSYVFATSRTNRLETQIAQQIQAGIPVGPLNTMEDLQEGVASFRFGWWITLGLCVVVVSGLVGIWFKLNARVWFAPIVGAIVLAELFWYAHDVHPQCDWELYYPSIAPLDRLADLPSDRVLGVGCLTPRLAEAAQLRDVRGYDGVDPSRFVELILTACANQDEQMMYAVTSRFMPKMAISPNVPFRLHPVLDMINVRYLIFRGKRIDGVRPFLAGDDYWVMENPSALSRLFVPSQVEMVPNDDLRLKRLADPSFDAARIALVEEPIDVPNDCRGSARIESELPGKVVVRATMETAGLLVMADMWDGGWKALVDGQPAAIVRTNHALRGIVLPAGESTVTFVYQPASVWIGVGIMVLSLFVLLIWGCVGGRLQRQHQMAKTNAS